MMHKILGFSLLLPWGANVTVDTALEVNVELNVLIVDYYVKE